MTITFSGLASNLDTQAIMDSLIKIEKIPLDQLTAQQTSVTQAQTAMSSFMSKVTALRSAAAALDDPTSYRSLTASSDTSGVSATVSGAAVPGSYAVQVTALAHEQRTRSNPLGSATDPLGQAGSVQIQIGSGTTVSVAVDAGDSLAAIADNINKSGARVAASVLYDGAQYRLMVRGLDTGAANAVNLSENGTTLGLDDPANTYQAASDAQLTVDGVSVTRSTNVVQGVIPGVSLNLTKETTSAANITVAADTGALTDKVNAFVTAYNAVVSSGHFTAGYGTLKAQVTMLQGDASVRATLDRLSRSMTSAVSGTSGRYTTLSSVGLATTRDGSIQLDSAKLADAIAKDPTAVSKLFTTDASIGATGAMGKLDTLIDALTVGTSAMLKGRVDALGKQATKLQEDADALQVRLDAYQTALQKQFTNLETSMSNVKSINAAYAGLTGYTSPFSSTTSSK